MKRPYAVWCLTDGIYRWWRYASYSTRERADAVAAEIRQKQCLVEGGKAWLAKVEVRP